MKTIIAFALLLVLGFGTTAYFGYEQHQEISDLQFQITALHVQVEAQNTVLLQQGMLISKQHQSISRMKSRATIVEDALVKVVEFIDALTAEPKHQSLPSS